MSFDRKAWLARVVASNELTTDQKAHLVAAAHLLEGVGDIDQARRILVHCAGEELAAAALRLDDSG